MYAIISIWKPSSINSLIIMMWRVQVLFYFTGTAISLSLNYCLFLGYNGAETRQAIQNRGSMNANLSKHCSWLGLDCAVKAQDTVLQTEETDFHCLCKELKVIKAAIMGVGLGCHPLWRLAIQSHKCLKQQKTLNSGGEAYTLS